MPGYNFSYIIFLIKCDSFSIFWEICMARRGTTMYTGGWDRGYGVIPPGVALKKNNCGLYINTFFGYIN